jgi:ubiquinone/menaquinone biosynthesis C-methylase UbiE
MDAMSKTSRAYDWGNTAAYEAYIGRWSRAVAEAFLEWLTLPFGRRWLDVGCGTGALTKAILAIADPEEVLGVDPTPEFLTAAEAQIIDPRVRFAPGDARALPVPSEAYDAVVAGLVLNFVPDPEASVAEMARAARSGGTVAGYVWDFAGERQFQRAFWEAATALDPAAAPLAQSMQFALCHREPLAALFGSAGLHDVRVQAIERPAVFRDLDDYWQPYLLGGSSVAQCYAASLGDVQRDALRERLQSLLPVAADGSIRLLARTWAVRGTK